MVSIPEKIEHARYIKLGSAKDKAADLCLEKGEAFIGFGTEHKNFFDLARSGDWDQFKKEWRLSIEPLVTGREIKSSSANRNATSATNQVKAFVEDDGSILWFTFHNGLLYWAFLDKDSPGWRDPDRGFVRKVRDKWRCKNLEGQPLRYNELSGRLTRTAAYRGTTCEIPKKARQYLLRRLQGKRPKEAIEAESAKERMIEALKQVITQFTFKDFELLSELVFTSRGWRRLSLTGSAMPFFDLILEQPLDKRIIGVQVKSVLKKDDLDEYEDKFTNLYSKKAGGNFETLYFVYHTDPKNLSESSKSREIELIGPDKIATFALDAGLVDWVIKRIE